VPTFTSLLTAYELLTKSGNLRTASHFTRGRYATQLHQQIGNVSQNNAPQRVVVDPGGITGTVGLPSIEHSEESGPTAAPKPVALRFKSSQ